MASRIVWNCDVMPVLDIGVSMQAFRDTKQAVGAAQGTCRRPSTAPRTSASHASHDPVSQQDEPYASPRESACGSDGDGSEHESGLESDAPSEPVVEDDLDRMEDAAENMRQTKPPQMCVRDECAMVAALKVKSRSAQAHDKSELVCLEHALQPSMIFDLMRAVLQMDESVVMQYLQAQKDQGEEFGLCMDRAFAHFCTEDTRQLHAVTLPAYAGTWKRDAGTLTALARNMRILLKAMKRDVGRTQLQAMLQQHPHIQEYALKVRDRIHDLMLVHQEQQEEVQEMEDIEESLRTEQPRQGSRYLDGEAAEDMEIEAAEHGSPEEDQGAEYVEDYEEA